MGDAQVELAGGGQHADGEFVAHGQHRGGAWANAKLLPPVRFADKDAKTLAAALAGHLVSREGANCLLDEKADCLVRVGKAAGAKPINDALDELNRRVQAKLLQKGDVVAIMISSHVLELPRGRS